MNNPILGKRFIFAVIAIICSSVVTIWLKYPDASYLKIIGIIVSVFTLGQSWTDIKEKEQK